MTAQPSRPAEIAVIEDNADLNSSLLHVLRSAGFASAGYDSVESFESMGGQPNIILLDLNLPGEDGLSFALRLRRDRPEVGIVMLTARDATAERRHGYECGADIYLTKPSSTDEVLGAISAIARRILTPPKPSGTGEGPAALILSPRQLELTGPACSVAVSAGDAAILMACAADPDGRIAFEAFQTLTPDQSALSKVAIELKIVRLRKKLAAAGCDGRTIGSVRNHGYQLLVPIRVMPS